MQFLLLFFLHSNQLVVKNETGPRWLSTGKGSNGGRSGSGGSGGSGYGWTSDGEYFGCLALSEEGNEDVLYSEGGPGYCDYTVYTEAMSDIDRNESGANEQNQGNSANNYNRGEESGNNSNGSSEGNNWQE